MSGGLYIRRSILRAMDRPRSSQRVVSVTINTMGFNVFHVSALLFVFCRTLLVVCVSAFYVICVMMTNYGGANENVVFFVLLLVYDHCGDLFQSAVPTLKCGWKMKIRITSSHSRSRRLWAQQPN